MNSTDFSNIVINVTSKLNIRAQEVENQVLELQLPNISWKTYIAWQLDNNGDTKSFHFCSTIGYIADSDAFLSLLFGNYGGIMGSPFYASLQEVGDNKFVTIETRQCISPTASVISVEEQLYYLFINSFFRTFLLGGGRQIESPIDGVILLR